jgi:hypothetical protein
VAPDGSKVFVTGYSSGDYLTVAYSTATGAQLWATIYNGPENSIDGASSLSVAPDGSKVFVTGYSYYRHDSGNPVHPPGPVPPPPLPGLSLNISSDYATVAYSTATGTELWAARYNGPGKVFGFSSVAVAPDGSKIFVTGGSSYDYYLDLTLGMEISSDSSDYLTVAYSTATGAELWASRYNGTGNSNNYAYSLAVAPDGSKVFVTGVSVGSDGSYDYATVAYRVTSCADGKDETGPASGPVHDQVEQVAGPTAAPYVHGVNCDVVAGNVL